MAGPEVYIDNIFRFMSIFLMSYVLLNFGVEYGDRQMIFFTELVHQSEARFPTFTLCKLGHLGGNDGKQVFSYREKVLRKYGYTTQDHYSRIGKIRSWHGFDNNSRTSAQAAKIFHEATYQCHEVINSLNLTFHPSKASPIQSTVISDLHLDRLFQVKRFKQYGRCYMFAPPKGTLLPLLKRGIEGITIKSDSQIKIFITMVDYVYDVSNRVKTTLVPGKHDTLEISYEDVRLIKRKLSDGKVCVKDFIMDYCLVRRVTSATLQKFGCVPPWLYADDRICTNASLLNQAAHYANARLANEKNDCPRPCDTVILTASNRHTITLPSRDIGVITLRFKTRVAINTQTPLYPVFSMVVEVIGWYQCLIGVSAYAFVAFVYKRCVLKMREE